MRIAVRKLKNNIDLNTLSTNIESSKINEEPKITEEPQNESVVELPEIMPENNLESPNFDEIINIEEPELNFENEPPKREKNLEKPQSSGFLGRIDENKKIGFSLSAPKSNNYGFAIYAGLGLTLLAQFIG